jgi:hypothetical protein
MEDIETPPPPLPERVQGYVLDAFGDGDEELGRDLLLSVARRVSYAREIHPSFGGIGSVADEMRELKCACSAFAERGDPRRMREEAIDVMATCIRLCNLEMPVEEKP